jgi:hypothetical protein
MASAFGARLGAAVTLGAACSCTALLGLDGKHFGSGGGALGGSSTSLGATSGAPSGAGGLGGAPATSASSSGGVTCTPGMDFTADPHNCGKCNHDCLGGACVAGACEPVSVVQEPGMLVVPYLLAIDNNWVYYVTQQGASYELHYRGVHDLPGATTGSLVGVDGASALAAAGGYVGWTTLTTVDAGIVATAAYAQKAQASPTPTLLYQGMGTIGPMVGHGQYFSFAVNQVDLVTRIPAGAEDVVVTPGTILSLAADSMGLYWVQGGGAIVAGGPLGMSGKPLFAEVGAGFLTTRDGDPNLYWIVQSSGTGTIRTAPKSGGAATTIGNPTLAPLSLAVDAEAVYAASLPSSCPGAQTGRIQRIDRTTLQETLLPGAICPFIVVADDVCIYWTDPNAGGLVRLAK